MAVISKGITLSVANEQDNDFKELTNLMEIPELGGEYDALEVTTLADGAHKYTDGLKNYGDSLAFKFLYEENQFSGLVNHTLVSGEHPRWQVTIPAGLMGQGVSCTFEGAYTVKLDGVGTNAVLTYTLTIKPSSEMSWMA